MSESAPAFNRLRLAFSNLSRSLPVSWNGIVASTHNSDNSDSEQNDSLPGQEKIKAAMDSFEKTERFLENIEDLASQWISTENELRTLGESLTHCLDEAVFLVNEPSVQYATRLMSSTLEAVNDVNQRSSECVTGFLLGISKATPERKVIAERRAQIIELDSALSKQGGRARKSADVGHPDIKRQREKLSLEQNTFISSLSQAERTVENHFSRELAVFVNRELDFLKSAAEIFARLQEPLSNIQRTLPIFSHSEIEGGSGDSVASQSTNTNGTFEILQLLSATDFSFAMVLAEVSVLSGCTLQFAHDPTHIREL